MGHRVVIIGGGFGGLYAAKALRRADVDITLLDRRNFHLFQPLLYQVATGELSPADVAFPLRAVLSKQRNATVLLAEVKDIDPDRRVVVRSDGMEAPYDSLIVATGAKNHYFGSDHWAEFAPGLKSLEDATRIRHRILYAFEAAEKETDPEKRRAWLTFVVVGAGPTGVELAGALGEIANDTLRDDFRSINPEEAQILLLDGSPRVLSPFVPELSAKAEQSLIRLGVRSVLNVKVVGVDRYGVRVQSQQGEQYIASRTVLWAAGVTAAGFTRTLANRLGIETDRGGRITVDAHCSVPGHPEIFVIGDASVFKGPDGKPLPGVAPTAMQQGSYVASAIKKRLRGEPLKPFRYRDKGTLAVIGRARAVAQFGESLPFSGLFAWLLWLFVHLMYLVTFQNRLIVFIRWGFNYTTFNRGARLITGDIDPGDNPEALKPLEEHAEVRRS
jgi:NADH:ubiquinone reductase (H+-translocating)